MDTPELTPFCHYSGEVLRPDYVGDTPRGRRVAMGIRNARWEGERFRASQRGETAGDWLLVGPDGTAMVDVRMSLRTDDGAFVFVEYQGRADWSAGIASAPVFSAPRLETDDERYRWLNSLALVAKGWVDGPTFAYDVFAVG